MEYFKTCESIFETRLLEVREIKAQWQKRYSTIATAVALQIQSRFVVGKMLFKCFSRSLEKPVELQFVSATSRCQYWPACWLRGRRLVFTRCPLGEGWLSVAVIVHGRVSNGGGLTAGVTGLSKRDRSLHTRAGLTACGKSCAADCKSHEIFLRVARNHFSVTLVLKVEETVAGEVWSNWLLGGRARRPRTREEARC